MKSEGENWGQGGERREDMEEREERKGVEEVEGE